MVNEERKAKEERKHRREGIKERRFKERIYVYIYTDKRKNDERQEERSKER